MKNKRYEFFKESNKIEGVTEEEAIYQNIDALQYLITEGELTHDTIKKVHEIIMKNRQPEIAGEYKDVENFVHMGKEIKVFCPPEKVKEKMTELLQITPETPMEALRWHINFENIHCFEDGNGRAGRVLLYYHLKEVLGVEPLVFRYEDRQGYYDLMNSLSNLYVDPEVEYREVEW